MLCGGDPVRVGHHVDRFDRLFYLELTLRIDLQGMSNEELQRILERLIPCPLCDGAGIIEPPERDYWAECPVCWGAMYRIPRDGDEPFDPTVGPMWQDISKPVVHAMFRNRLRDGRT